MLIDHSLRATLHQLQQVLSELSDAQFEKSLPILSDSSIGQHTRHIIEFFQALIYGYETGIINYDKRQRNKLLETDRKIALEILSSIVDKISFEDKEILLQGSYSSDTPEDIIVKSTYYREVVYNLEHAIHHMAMIKVGIRQSTNLVIPSDFGVAPATIQYKKSVL